MFVLISGREIADIRLFKTKQAAVRAGRKWSLSRFLVAKVGRVVYTESRKHKAN
jgi:hypothetical protein